MKKKFDILVVGELNVDIILSQIESFPEMSKEKLANGMDVVLGSSSAILASNLSSMGAKVAFVGKIGQDQFGELCINSLKEKGVDCSMITVDANQKTGATVVMSFENDRANVTYPGAMNHLTIDDISDEMLSSARHLHFSSCFLQPGIKEDLPELFGRAKTLGLSTSIDPQWDPSENWELDLNGLLRHVDYFMPNVSELTAMTSEDSVAQALDSLQTKNTVVVKNGTQGATMYHEKLEHHQPAVLNENVVDTVGAGDSFNSGFLFKLLQGESLKQCMEFASLTGAVSTTASGGTGAFTSLEAVLKTIDNTFGHKSHETTTKV